MIRVCMPAALLAVAIGVSAAHAQEPQLSHEQAIEQQRLATEATRRARAQEEQQSLRAEAAAAAAAAEQAAQGATRVGQSQAEWVHALSSRVRKFWLRPVGTAAQFTCRVEVNLDPAGSVQSARIVQSSGHAGLDRSVLQAVLKASPLPTPSEPAAFVPVLVINFCPSPGNCGTAP